MTAMTERQQRELAYHRGHATSVADQYKSINYDVISVSSRKWWNAYWDIWTFILDLPLQGKNVLIVGCGGGRDAFLFAKLGAHVSAFDLSSDMLAHGIRLAAQDGLSIAFDQMAAEKMGYPTDMFDIVFARDILHHVDIPATMSEIVRVSKRDALFIVDEIYSHSITEVIRRSWLVEKVLYPNLQRFIYNNKKPYITEDERKMTERDVAEVKSHMLDFRYNKYFNFFVTRVVPDNYRNLNKLDRAILMMLGPLGHFFAGRISFVGCLQKQARA